MPITITKLKEPPAEKQEIATDVTELTPEDLADQYGALQDQVGALLANPVFTRFEQVKKELSSRLEAELEPTDTAEITGQNWLLEIGVAAKNSRALKPGAIPLIQKFLGVETFAKIAKVSISDCEKYLTPEQVDKTISTDTGYSSRRKIVAKYLGGAV